MPMVDITKQSKYTPTVLQYYYSIPSMSLSHAYLFIMHRGMLHHYAVEQLGN